MSRRCCRSRELRQRSWEFWTPRMAQTARAWLDASDLSTLSGLSSSVWRDKINSANNTSAQNSAPSLVQSVLNGLPVVRFNGTNQALALPAGWISGSTTIVYLLIRRGAGTNDGYSPDFGIYRDTSDSGAIHYIKSDLKGAAYAWLGGGNSGNYDGAGTYSVGVPVLLSFVHAGNASVTVFRNGTQEGTYTQNTSPGGVQFLHMSRQLNLSRYSQNDYCELVGFASGNANDRLRAEGYILWKWRLQANLPAAHPFKLRPPLVGD